MPVAILEGAILFRSDYALSQEAYATGVKGDPAQTDICHVHLWSTAAGSPKHLPIEINTAKKGKKKEDYEQKTLSIN